MWPFTVERAMPMVFSAIFMGVPVLRSEFSGESTGARIPASRVGLPHFARRSDDQFHAPPTAVRFAYVCCVVLHGPLREPEVRSNLRVGRAGQDLQ